MIYRGVREELNNAEETDADDPDSELAANNKETRRDLSTREAEDSDEGMRHCVRVQIHSVRLLTASASLIQPIAAVVVVWMVQRWPNDYREQFSLLQLRSRKGWI